MDPPPTQATSPPLPHATEGGGDSMTRRPSMHRRTNPTMQALSRMGMNGDSPAWPYTRLPPPVTPHPRPSRTSRSANGGKGNGRPWQARSLASPPTYPDGALVCSTASRPIARPRQHWSTWMRARPGTTSRPLRCLAWTSSSGVWPMLRADRPRARSPMRLRPTLSRGRLALSRAHE